MSLVKVGDGRRRDWARETKVKALDEIGVLSGNHLVVDTLATAASHQVDEKAANAKEFTRASSPIPLRILDELRGELIYFTRRNHSMLVECTAMAYHLREILLQATPINSGTLKHLIRNKDLGPLYHPMIALMEISLSVLLRLPRTSSEAGVKGGDDSLKGDSPQRKASAP